MDQQSWNGQLKGRFFRDRTINDLCVYMSDDAGNLTVTLSILFNCGVVLKGSGKLQRNSRGSSAGRVAERVPEVRNGSCEGFLPRVEDPEFRAKNAGSRVPCEGFKVLKP